METISTQHGWLRLPAMVQTDLMMEVGLSCIEALHRCILELLGLE